MFKLFVFSQQQAYIYLNTSIQELTENTEFDTVCLCPWHVQMTQFGVCPLVCPFSIWPGQGFYVDIFLIDAFPSQQQSKWKRAFSGCFQCKDIKLAALLHNFRGHKNIHQCHQFYLNYVGKRRGFPWPLVYYIPNQWKFNEDFAELGRFEIAALIEA